MKRLSALFLVAASLTAGAQTINQSGFSFSPATLTVDAGDEITTTIGSPLTCTEVTEATWNANGNTSNGGFNFSAGTHTLTLTIPGTYYYVCQPHASMGMKGQIIVNSTTGVEENNATTALRIFPNPASTEVQVTTAQPGQVITLIDAQGREALRQVVNSSGRLDLSALEPGNYAVLLTNAARKVVARERLTIAR